MRLVRSSGKAAKPAAASAAKPAPKTGRKAAASAKPVAAKPVKPAAKTRAATKPTPAAPLLTVVPDLVEDVPVVSLAAEIQQAEKLVEQLDREVRGGTPTAADRWRNEDGRTDDELVLAARTGDDNALCDLLNKYRAFARVKARSYFLVGADREDIVQEGMIGLYKAIRDFNPDMQSSFRAFAELCVTRQIITAIKTATRQKHGPLNNYVSFERPGRRRRRRRPGARRRHPDRRDQRPGRPGHLGRADPRPAGALRRGAVRPRDRGAAALRRGQELPGDRRAARSGT